MSVTVDNSDFRRYAAALGEGARRVPREARDAVRTSAQTIADQMNQNLAGSASFKGISGAVTFDMKGSAASSEAEIGPEKGSPGSLANIAFFGSSRGGGTVEDPGITLEREVPTFVKALEAVMERAVP